MTTEAEDRLANAWRDSAPYWEMHRESVRAMFAPLTAALLEAADIESGHHVLDVAGGPGEPAFTIADRVGRDGSVLTTDIAEGMVAATRRHAESIGADTVRTAVCSAQALPFRKGSFDRVVSRLGAMFFPDAEAAIREMARVTRPDGRIAFVVWGTRDRNPFFRVASDVIARFFPSEPDPPDAPGAWRFAEPGALAGLVSAAGLANVLEDCLSFRIELPIDFDTFWRMRVELSDTLREKMARLDAAAVESATAAVRHDTYPYFPNGTMAFPAEALVVVGSTPEQSLR